MVDPIQIINNTGTVNIGQSHVDWLILTAPLVAAVIGFFTIWYSRKQHNRNAMIDIFEMLNEDNHKGNHKAAQEILFTAHKENRLYDSGGFIIDGYKPTVNIISRNYDEIGLLANRKLIPRKDFFYMYGKLVVVSHFILFYAINHKRLHGEPDYMTNFTKLAIHCYYYWKDERRLPRDPRTNKEIEKSVIKEWEKSLPK
ncbi:MAG: hypothetical protein EPO62_06450 [Candidatus Nitrosotenuis sp.]|nr:MAG: hypothetical protein EPO62_06450 [Candidatus Nitrosotenuis sp.]